MATMTNTDAPRMIAAATPATSCQCWAKMAGVPLDALPLVVDVFWVLVGGCADFVGLGWLHR